MRRFSSHVRAGLIAASALTLALPACSTHDAPPDEPLATTQQANVCAAGATVKGVDVSVYQGNVDWNAAHAAGLDFAIARISDGTYMDTKFDQNWSGIKAAGMVRGAYQFFEPGVDPVAQANIVIQKVGVLGTGDLPVTADVEVTGGQSSATIAANLQIWIDHVKAGTGKTPMIYTAPGWWNGNVGSSSFGAEPLWVANWGVSCPSVPTGWSNWVVWQNSDMGSVNGIPATVDLDEFNGDLNALLKFAGAAPDWGAQYVEQSWPLATTTLTMTVNQSLPAYITLKNIGQKTWDSSTKLATTQPRDRSSPFVAPDWLAPNRLAAVAGTIAPGQDYKFQFTFRAPSAPGMYDEFFGVVQEGVSWFSDPGQAGPPDNVIEAKIQVVEAQYHGDFVSQTFPSLQAAPITMTPGQKMSGTITLKNVGTATWKAGETKLAPTPRDMPSALASASWLSPTRVSTPAADVPPGGSFAFPLEITAPAAGDYKQTFSLVEDGVTWFGDAPKGGGPGDDLLAVHVVVSPTTGAATSSGQGGGASGAGGGGGSVDKGIHGGCGCRTAGAAGGLGAAPIVPLLAVLAALRRRRRAARR